MIINFQEIITSCKTRWGTGSYLETLEEKIISWLANATEEEKEVLIKLLKKFDYYPNRRASVCLQDIHQNVEKRLQEKLGEELSIYDNVLFFPVTKRNGNRTSAFHIYGLYTLVNDISKYCCKVHIDSVVNDTAHKPFEHVNHVVFIEDMIGTGKTIRKFFKQTFEVHPFLKEKHLYLIVLEARPEGIKVIQDFLKPINLEIFYSKLHQKAFLEENVFIGEELIKAKQIIEDLEMRISDDEGKHVLGFDRSESLMAFFHNTPNNTLSCFWKKNDVASWAPLFAPRDDHIPNYMRKSSRVTAKALEKEKEIRGKINYTINKKRRQPNGF